MFMGLKYFLQIIDLAERNAHIITFLYLNNEFLEILNKK